MIITRWYVAQLKAGRERIAIHALADQGFENYYPSMPVTRLHRGRVIERLEPVFPRYLFLRATPDPACWRSINGTRGIHRLLGNDCPCALPDREVERLQESDRAGLLSHPHRRHIRAGDRVEFRLGSLVGFQGICQWTRRERIAVLLQMLGGDTVAVSPRDWLKLAVA